MTTRTILLTTSALLLGVLITGAYISVPLPIGVPLTLQTMALMLIGLLLPLRWALATVMCYLSAGALGFPVFSHGTGGLACFVGPTGGFLIGFLAMPLAMNVVMAASPHRCRPWRIFLACLVGLVPVFVCGSIWLAIQTSTSLRHSVAICLLPYIPGSLLKAVLATLLYVELRQRIPTIVSTSEGGLDEGPSGNSCQP